MSCRSLLLVNVTGAHVKDTCYALFIYETRSRNIHKKTFENYQYAFGLVWLVLRKSIFFLISPNHRLHGSEFGFRRVCYLNCNLLKEGNVLYTFFLQQSLRRIEASRKWRYAGVLSTRMMLCATEWNGKRRNPAKIVSKRLYSYRKKVGSDQRWTVPGIVARKCTRVQEWQRGRREFPAKQSICTDLKCMPSPESLAQPAIVWLLVLLVGFSLKSAILLQYLIVFA